MSRLGSLVRNYKFGIFLFFLFCFLFFYFLNWCTPMHAGDDYLYSFVWQGGSMYKPLPKEAERFTSLRQVVDSTFLHYYTWGGRMFVQFLSFLFGWVGKNVFNICNTVMILCLFTASSFISLCGLQRYVFLCKCRYKYFLLMLFLSFFCFWEFNPDMPSDMLWMSGALNYLWPSVLVYVYLFPFVSFFYGYDYLKSYSLLGGTGLMFLGIFIGYSHEFLTILVLFFLVLLGYFVYCRVPFFPWHYATGFSGVVIGFFLCSLSPGNNSRLRAEALYGLEKIDSFTGDVIIEELLEGMRPFYESVLSVSEPWWMGIDSGFVYYNFLYVMQVYKVQLLLWLFVFLVFCGLKKLVADLESMELKKDLQLLSLLLGTVFLSYVMMLFIPAVSLRISFFSLVFLSWAFLVSFRLYLQFDMKLVGSLVWKRLICIYVCVMFVYSLAGSVPAFYELKRQDDVFLSTLRSFPVDTLFVLGPDKAKQSVPYYFGLPFPVCLEVCSSSFHENVLHWKNMTIARYYGIKGILVKPGK